MFGSAYYIWQGAADSVQSAAESFDSMQTSMHTLVSLSYITDCMGLCLGHAIFRLGLETCRATPTGIIASATGNCVRPSTAVRLSHTLSLLITAAHLAARVTRGSLSCVRSNQHVLSRADTISVTDQHMVS